MFLKGKAALIVLSLVLLSGCNVTKHLKDNETLYTGGEVKINNIGRVPGKKALKQQLEELLPKENFKILGMRPKLWAYYKVGPVEKKKGFKYWLRNKFGEPPVLNEDINTEKVENNMLKVLYNQGYFDANVEYEDKRKGKKIELIYTAEVKRPYYIKEFILPKPKNKLDSQLVRMNRRTLLKPGKDYNLEVLQEERDRIDQRLKNLGYYYFNADYLIFRADSTVGDRSVNLYLEVKPDAPEKSLLRYSINEIYMNPDFAATDTTTATPDTVQYNNINYIKKGNGFFRPQALTRIVFLKEDSLYKRKDHNITLNRLMGLDVFKYVNLKFLEVEEAKDGKAGLLNASILMSPLPKKNLRAEIQAFTKSTQFAGPRLQFSFRNRNAFRGAELLQFNFNTSFETQISGQFKGYPAYEVEGNVQLFLPRFLTPIPIKNRNSIFLPRTKLQLGYMVQNRIGYMNQRAFNTSYGFQWKETQSREHEFNPINISYVNFKMNKKADNDNPSGFDITRLASLENQFILGSNYAYTFNNLLEKRSRRRTHFYFNGNVDVSGNLMYLAQRAITGREPTPDNPFTLWGDNKDDVLEESESDGRYAQYAKNDIDFRVYYDFSATSRLATRIFAGLGYAYGNSQALPFAKQYYIGGPTSIRAFRARSLGPGVFKDSSDINSFFTQMGDIRLEGNVEYRFDLISVLKGAFFVDAGNIWLARPDETKTSVDVSGERKNTGVFDKRSFMKEIAVGTGFGLRVDVSFVVLRLDLAFPVRKFHEREGDSYRLLPESERWVFNKINFFDPSWRKENLVLNIAIGYPF